MGFSVSDYSICGLVRQIFYVSIRGCYTIQKTNQNSPDIYCINYVIYFHALNNTNPIIYQQNQAFTLAALPNQNDIYAAIYANIKKNMDPTNTLEFTDD